MEFKYEKLVNMIVKIIYKSKLNFETIVENIDEKIKYFKSSYNGVVGDYFEILENGIRVRAFNEGPVPDGYIYIKYVTLRSLIFDFIVQGENGCIPCVLPKEFYITILSNVREKIKCW